MAKWSNAPVVYVIVQVRFSAVLSLSSYLAAIQEHFRKKGFPVFAQRFNFQLGLSLTPPDSASQSAPPIPMERLPAFVFSNRDSSQTFILEPSALTFHVSDYEDFEWLLDRFLEPLSEIIKLIAPDLSERIGLRYIDAVIPRNGAAVQEYLVPEVLGLSQPRFPGTLEHSFSESAFSQGETKTVIRVLSSSGQIAFPPDLAFFPVTVRPALTSYVGPHAVIDTDSFQMGRSEMNLSSVRGILNNLHENLRQALRSVSTELAISEWK